VESSGLAPAARPVLFLLYLLGGVYGYHTAFPDIR